MSNDDTRPSLHQGEGHSSPYPMSRLAPAFEMADLAAEVALAQSMLSARTGAKLRVIADQIRALQEEARKVLAQAREEQALTNALCGFKRIPGHSYHLYRKGDDTRFFSMLSPADWGGAPPHAYLGTYRLEADYSWTPADREQDAGDTGGLVEGLLRIGGIAEGEP